MSDVDDLVTQLRAQLDVDERVARACIYDNATGRWYVQAADGYIHEAVTDETGLRLATGTDAVNVHAARHDPARVLREVEAKRLILNEYEASRSRYLALADARARSLALTKPEPSDEERRAMDMADAYAQAVRLLARASAPTRPATRS